MADFLSVASFMLDARFLLPPQPNFYKELIAFTVTKGALLA
jgi:hypothetical protein